MTGYEIAQEQIKQFKEYQEYQCADYVVDISYKYDFQKHYTRENVVVEICCGMNNDEWLWSDDWYEGQTDVIVHGIIYIGNIPKEIFKTEKEKKKK